MNYQKHHGWVSILGLWLLGAFCDRLWFALDRSIPSWDQADYLTGALNYWQALQTPQWFSGEWWRSLWLLSSKMPPGTYIITAFFHNLFGIEADHATLVYLFFSAILLPSVYGLGRLLFNSQVGVWAAALCLMFPGLYHARLDFLLDFPLTALVTFSFYALTLWKVTEKLEVPSSSETAPESQVSSFLRSRACQSWFWAVVLGLSVGLALMVKQTALFFLITPIVWVIFETVRDRQWVRFLQLMVAAFLSGLVMYPWYGTNWLLVFTGSQRAAIQAAVAEGDPAIHTLPAWTFYAEQFPHHVSWPFLVVPVAGFIFSWWRSRGDRTSSPLTAGLQNPVWRNDFKSPFKWLAIFWIGSYVFFSLILNKDFRYVLPYLPVVALVLAYGLMLFPRSWGKWVRWGTCSAALVLILADVWPVYDWNPDIVASHHAYRGPDWPHREAIAEIMETSPYLRSTLGVLPSTPMINQHNLNYYGNLQQFQVYGRQVGTRRSHVAQDARSLDWFLTKTGNQGSVPTEAQGAIVALVETGGEFDLQASWPLPDESTLNLYHHRLPMVTVEAVEASATEGMITLDRVTVPAQSPPGVPVPVTYEWTGDWDLLRDGVVVLTWQLQSPAASTLGRDSWLHDHGIGKGELQAVTAPVQAKVIERMAMLPPADVVPGTYTLAATYLNRKTGETQGMEVPAVAIAINPAAPATPAPELDWITQLRSLSAALPQGPEALEFIFDDMGRVNQYDPIQDYLIQAEKSLEYRLQQEPENVELAYNLGFSQVLQQDVQGAISAFERVVQLDSENPYAHAYLGFVNLYGWHPRQAEPAIKQAMALRPEGVEIQLLYGVSALMQGNIFGTWSRLRGFVPPLVQFFVLLMGWMGLFLLGVIVMGIGVKYRKGFGKGLS